MAIRAGGNTELIDDTRAQKPVTLVDVVNFFWRWRKPLLYLCLLAIILAVLFSSPWFIKPKFKATHIFYPTTNNSISNALLTDQNQREKDPLEFGEDEEAEKALQILQSSQLTSRLVRNFQLMKHYGIDPSKTKYPETALQSEIESNITYTRTRYLSVKIDVLDKDPVMAAQIANGIAALYDSIKTDIQRQIAIPAFEIVKRALQEKRDKINDIKNKLRTLGEGGITNYEEQSRALAEEIYKAQSSGRIDKMKDLIEQQKLLVANGGEFIALNELIKIEEEKESDLITQFEKRQVDVNENLSNKFTVSAASKPEKKAWPVRSLIVLITMLATFCAASLFLLIYEVIYLNKKDRAQRTAK